MVKGCPQDWGAGLAGGHVGNTGVTERVGEGEGKM